MNNKYLNKKVIVHEKDNKITKGIILYWVKEQDEKEFILINDKCIYVEDIQFIEEDMK